MDDAVPSFVKKSELQQLWNNGKGSAKIADNVERLVESLIMREAELLIEQNKHRAKKTATFKHVNHGIDDLDEIEDLEDIDVGGGGLQFYNPSSRPNNGPTSKPTTSGGPSGPSSSKYVPLLAPSLAL